MQSSKVPQLQSFLFCFSLLTGSKIIGYLKVILQLLTAITIFVIYCVHVNSLTNFKFFHFFGPIVVFVCGLSFIEAYFAVILLHGLTKRKPAYVKIWVVIQFSILIQNIASLVILTIISIIFVSLHTYHFEFKHLVVIISNIIADIYCTLVVYSYYRDEYYRDRSGNIINADILDTLE